MADQVIRALLQRSNVKVVVCTAELTAREGARLHRLAPMSALMLSQGLLGAVLLASLQKGTQRINLQLECDGPLHGLFVDASADGGVRGYVKNPNLLVLGEPGAFRWRPALGNSGFLSVLRDLAGGEYYRSSVQLQAMSLAEDLTHYFETSDQVATQVALDVLSTDQQPLDAVAGVLVQALPGTAAQTVAEVSERLHQRLHQALLERPTAASLARALFTAEPLDVLETVPLQWQCPCSLERVLNALSAMGKAELQDMLAEDGKASASCQFCGKTHVASAADLQALIDKL